MKLDRNLTARRTVSRATFSPVVALLAMAALLLGVFAIHSAATGHEMHSPLPAASASVDQSVDGMAMAAAAVVAPAVVAMESGTHGGMLDCALLAMSCVLLLIVVAVVFLARRPATYRRLLDAGDFVIASFRAVPLPIHRPSLIVLAISRV